MSKILIADRDLSCAKFIKRILVRRNISNLDDIVLMSDGLHVRETLLENSYDLAIISMYLEGMDGLNCIQYLKRKKIRQNFLLLIYNANIEVTREACLLGVQGVYEVPILIDSFIAIIKNMLSNKRSDLGNEIYDLHTKWRFYGQSER